MLGDGNFDYLLCILSLFILGCFLLLLAPTPGERRKGPRTHDTRNVRRIR